MFIFTYRRSQFFLIAALAAMLIGIIAPALSIHLAAQEQDDADATPMASPQATPVGEGSPEALVFNPVADTYVERGEPDEIFGEEDRLVSDEDPYSETYIMFEVEGADEPVVEATLRLWVSNPTNHAPTLWLAPPASWSESEMTWNTRPALDEVVEEKERGNVPEDEWIEYDVTDAVTGDGMYTFVLIPESTDGMDVHSREADENQPELVVDAGFGAGSSAPMPSSDEPVLLAAGDIATCGGDGAEMTAQILDEEPGIVITLGDNAYNEGTAQQFRDCYDPTWGRHKERTRPTPGNHEYYTRDAEPYFAYFGESAGEPGKGYYSYSIDEWHVIALNTNIEKGEDSEQVAWLREELESSPAQCTVAYAHHPRFASGQHGTSESMIPIFSVLYEYGVELYLAGHEHHYERYAPQDPDGELDLDHGVRQFVVGTGGISTRGFPNPSPNSEVRTADAHGVLRLELLEDGYMWEFLSVEDKSFYDSGMGSCHDAADTPDEGASGHGGQDAWLVMESRRTTRAYTLRNR